jgi:hypothetical protein
MEVPISQFRKNLFTLVDQALDGKEVWVRHKGRRLRIVPEGPAQDKLSRITPIEILAPGMDLEGDSWKADIMREWEQKWDRKLPRLSEPVKTASMPARPTARKTRRKA